MKAVKNILTCLGIGICLLALATGTAMANPSIPGKMLRDTVIKKAAIADKESGDSDEDGKKVSAKDVSAILIADSKTGTFEDKAKYTYQVNNPTNKTQTGKVTYQVYTMKDVKLKTQTLNITVAPKSAGKYPFEIAGMKPGFYKINFMVDVTDGDTTSYDDTTMRAFGIKPETLRSQYAKPADFEDFWKKTKDELAAVPPDFKVTYMPDSGKDNRKVYLIEMKSLGNLTVRGYLTVPKTESKNKKFVVLVGLPGYQVSLPPMFGADNDLAILTLNVRGQGNSRDVIHTPRTEYIFYHIEDKNKYVLRGAIMDCVRAIDFIFTQPNLDHNKILVSGGSMGGFLSIATCAVDGRVALCSAQNPILSDINNLDGEVDWPLIDIRSYISSKPGLTYSKVMQNLNYFDTKNFAAMLKCPTLLGMGMLDPIVPPNNAYIDYNNITAKKHIIIFRDLGHEVGAVYKAYEGRWMRDTFGLF
jgi:cephalosporin-C deacetylase